MPPLTIYLLCYGSFPTQCQRLIHANIDIKCSEILAVPNPLTFEQLSRLVISHMHLARLLCNAAVVLHMIYNAHRLTSTSTDYFLLGISWNYEHLYHIVLDSRDCKSSLRSRAILVHFRAQRFDCGVSSSEYNPDNLHYLLCARPYSP